jgi:hypothetical protein
MFNKKTRVTTRKRFINYDKYQLIFISTVLLFVFSFVARLYFAANLTSKNFELKDLYTQKVELEQQVARMKFENLTLSSLDSLKIRASSLGYIEHQGLLLSLDLTTSKPLALR